MCGHVYGAFDSQPFFLVLSFAQLMADRHTRHGGGGGGGGRGGGGTTTKRRGIDRPTSSCFHTVFLELSFFFSCFFAQYNPGHQASDITLFLLKWAPLIFQILRRPLGPTTLLRATLMNPSASASLSAALTSAALLSFMVVNVFFFFFFKCSGASLLIHTKK